MLYRQLVPLGRQSIFLVPILWLYGIVATVVGVIKAGQGEAYRYPLTIRFL